MHFWAPEYTRSMFHASVKKGSPTGSTTVSTTRRVPCLWHSSPTPSSFCLVPEEDSPWHRKSTAGFSSSRTFSISSERRGQAGLLADLHDLGAVPEALLGEALSPDSGHGDDGLLTGLEEVGHGGVHGGSTAGAQAEGSLVLGLQAYFKPVWISS